MFLSIMAVIGKASNGWLIGLDNDKDLGPRRGSPRFTEIVERAKARFAMQDAGRDA